MSPPREAAGGIIAPLSAARTAQRAVPTRFRVQSAKISWNSSHEPESGSPALQRLMQFRFMGREQVRKEHGAFHEPAPSPLPSSAGAECGPLGQSVVRKQFQKEQDPTGWPAREDLSSVAWRRLEARPTESA